MKYFILGFKKWNDVSGRSNLKEFWYFTLFYLLFYLLFLLVDGLYLSSVGKNIFETPGLLESVFSLVCFVPSLTLTVRRLHDINKSGYHLLWYFTIIGILFVLIMNMLKGTEGDNNYGSPSTH
tara:strand:- start:1948 stop:2316 length:369 start_codon:yes stop_codon:yes gene_type:complete